MAVVLNEEGTILGWYLVNLDDDAPKRLYHIAEKLGLNVERLIDEAIREKAERMDMEIKKNDAGRICVADGPNGNRYCVRTAAGDEQLT